MYYLDVTSTDQARDGKVLLNLNNFTLTSATLAEGVSLQAFDASTTAGGSVTTIDGDYDVCFENITGTNYILVGDNDNGYTSHSYTASVSVFLRASGETLAFQGNFKADTTAAELIDDIGLILSANGNEQKISYAAYEYTENALAGIKETGDTYNAARVALNSDNIDWWTYPITMEAYITIDGVDYAFDGATRTYTDVIETLLANETYAETVQAMIDGSANKAAYEAFLAED